MLHTYFDVKTNYFLYKCFSWYIQTSLGWLRRTARDGGSRGSRGQCLSSPSFEKSVKNTHSRITKIPVSYCIFIYSKTWKKFFMDCVKHATFNTAGGRDFKICLWEIGSLLVNKFSRETGFSNKLFRISHQGRMPWKLAGATNLCLQINLIFSILANVVLHSYI